jgi:hypothetical protein
MRIYESFPFCIYNTLVYNVLCFFILKKVIQKIYFYSFYMRDKYSKMEIA